MNEYVVINEKGQIEQKLYLTLEYARLSRKQYANQGKHLLRIEK